jgi:cytidylate kinase
MMKNYIITIARGFGSGGKEIAKGLSAELGISWYDRELLEIASEKTGLNIGVFQQVDEKLRNNSLLSALKTVQGAYKIAPEENEFVADENLFFIQAEIIAALAITESCVIVGRCADYILQAMPNVINIYIEAPREYCVKSVISSMNVSEKEAHRLIRKTDAYRANYYRYYTRGRDWRNPIHYDMTLNSAKIGRENCVKIIKAYAQIKFPALF